MAPKGLSGRGDAACANKHALLDAIEGCGFARRPNNVIFPYECTYVRSRLVREDVLHPKMLEFIGKVSASANCP
eukprot:2777373-Alexandrium_andersonii.AAC.1